MNILIAEDHRLFLEGLKQLVCLLYPDAVIKEAGNGVDALTLITEGNQLDLALVDQRLPRLDGFTLLKKLSQTYPYLPVLIVSSSEDPDDMELAFRLGASGFAPKSFTPEELREVIDSLLGGEKYQVPLPRKKEGVSSWSKQHKITPRQLEVLRLAKKGKDNHEIARSLYITERTVKAHLTALFDSFKAKSRTELVHNASQLGLD